MGEGGVKKTAKRKGKNIDTKSGGKREKKTRNKRGEKLGRQEECQERKREELKKRMAGKGRPFF